MCLYWHCTLKFSIAMSIILSDKTLFYDEVNKQADVTHQFVFDSF